MTYDQLIAAAEVEETLCRKFEDDTSAFGLCHHARRRAEELRKLAKIYAENDSQ